MNRFFTPWTGIMLCSFAAAAIAADAQSPARKPFREPAWGWIDSDGDASGMFRLHVVRRPDTGEIEITPPFANITQAYLVDDPVRAPLALEIAPDGKRMTIRLPEANRPAVDETTIVVETAERTHQFADGRIVLSALDAEVVGSTAKLESQPGNHRIGFWTKPQDFIRWSYPATRPGSYVAELTWSRAGAGPVEIAVVAGDQELRSALPATGNWYRYQSQPLGRLVVSKSGAMSIAVKCVGPAGSAAVMNLKSLTLRPVSEGRPIVQGADRVVVCHARDATIHGVALQFEPKPEKNTLGFWVNPDDWASWEFTVVHPGMFTVEILQGCGKGQGGSEATLSVAGQALPFVVEDTGHFQNFKPREIGVVRMDRAGPQTLSVKPLRKAHGAIMDLRQVRLIPRAPAAIKTPPPAAGATTPPPTRVENVQETLHGVVVDDPYRWLEDQGHPETRGWIAAQNEYTERVLGRLPHRTEIARRAAELMKVETIGIPTVRGERYFFTRRAATANLPAIFLRQGRTGVDQVLIDPALMSREGTTTVSLIDVSQDGALLLYGVREGGEDEVRVRLYDVNLRETLDEELPRGRYFGVALSRDKQSLYYARHTPDGTRVFEHRRGASEREDRLIFGDKYGPGVIITAGLSDDARYLILHVLYGSAAPKSEIYYQKLASGEPLQTLVNDVDARFIAAAVGDDVFLQTNWNAPNGRILRGDLRQPGREHWQEVVPASNAVIDSFSLVGGRLYVHALENVISRIRVHETSGAAVRDIKFAAIGSVSGVGGEWNHNEAFFAFDTAFIAPTIYSENVQTGQQTVWSKPDVPIEPEQFEARQVWVTSRDKTRVPMFVAHKRGLKLDGSHPALMTGYGGFNISLTPHFSPQAVIWMEQGGVYAMPNLRGGGEFGEDWHAAGMLQNKQNVFDDFFAAAEWLIAQGYTTPARLAITGRSNGGLLVGAALTQRPELFRAVICGYPLLDMVRFHRFLVARFWVPEYGSAEDAAQFRALHAYSPYHHVQPGQSYPAVLFVTGDADTRVAPLHARKMTARLQAAAAPGRPVLLRYDTQLGHTGARPISQRIDDVTDELSFLFQETGVEPGTPNAGAPVPPAAAALAPAAALQALFDDEWEWTLREQPTFASSLGDRRYNDRWPNVSLAAIEQRHAHQQDVLHRLETIDVTALSPADRLNHRLFQREYATEVEEHAFRFHLMPINPREGIQDENSLADSLPFETVKDYNDWLARLNAFPVYMEQTLALLREGVRAKIVQPKIVMKRLPAQIRRQIVDDPARSLYFAPFESFPEGIAPVDRARLTAAAREAISQKIVPAYRDLLAFFESEYFPACFDAVGAWQLPNGAAAYAFCARKFTTTSLTPAEIHAIGLREVRRIRAEMEAIVKEVGFTGTFPEFLASLRTDDQFYFKDAQELLRAYQALCKQVDPQLPRLFRKLPRIPYGVEAIPEHIAPDTTTAYYRPPAADGSRAGTYFVNLYKPETRPKYEIEALSLHEAVPGHHLQIALATELEDLPAFRRFASITAYIEGWGLYAESLGSDLGLYRDPYSRFGRLTYEMWRAVRLVVDTGMHAQKWTRQQALDFFRENTAKSELDMANEVDRYISWPGQALAYKIGELKIQELRRRATEKLGSRFDIREFHDEVLKHGAVPLDVLEELVDAWIRERGERNKS